jgi:hypothetical protein
MPTNAPPPPPSQPSPSAVATPPTPYRFEVAFSFAGDGKRDKVRSVAELLREELGDGRVFFDEWFEAELAGHDAQLVLQDFYRKQARVVVACLCHRYGEKPWTQDEWRAIQALERGLRDATAGNIRRMRLLPLRFGDGEVDGLFDTAIVPDVRDRPPRKIADLILERLQLAQRPSENVATEVAHAAEQPANKVDPFRDDWQKLEARSNEFAEDLRRRGRSRWGIHALEVTDRDILTTIATELERESILLTGAAGDGKSSILPLLKDRLEAKRARVVLLPIDEIVSPTLDGIQGDLDLSHRLERLLEATVNAPPAYLLVDTLESSRDREAPWKKLVATAISNPGWRVLATIRDSALDHAKAWRQRFTGAPIGTPSSSATEDVRHIVLPPFSRSELQRLLVSIPGAWDKLSTTSERIQSLLANPFNLRLLMEVTDPDTFSVESLRSQRILLDRYWKVRVLETPHPFERGAMLEKVASSNLPLRHVDLAISDAMKAALDGLVEDGVLKRNGRTGVVAFAHDLIEDYTLALRLDEDPWAVADFLQGPAPTRTV